ncbi:hypothetical protein P3X46_008894 [Hevea brasiliensis]|uniref:Uncharacterized protein n=1 Tax=Hevea brasiliensis TaxID=3981 RepID=A0ABQ9MNM3_HEVBR|nr:hypothetical protein P3X46_008894 [Hevea brasiliensis]
MVSQGNDCCCHRRNKRHRACYSRRISRI